MRFLPGSSRIRGGDFLPFRQGSGEDFEPEVLLLSEALASFRVRELERQIEQQRAGRPAIPKPGHDAVLDLAPDIGTVWNDPKADSRLKTRIVRELILEVITNVDAASGEIVLLIYLNGGMHTELLLPRRKRGQCTATSKEVVVAVRVLARICTDQVIAGVLNRNGRQTGRGNRWMAVRVVTLRNWNNIPVYAAERQQADGWMNLTEAATFLRLAVEQGRLPGEHPLPDGPWIFQRVDLETDSARQVGERAWRQAGNPGSGLAADNIPSLFSELRKGAE